MIAKIILIGGEYGILICDAKCHKAWGNDNRPKEQLSSEEDDWEYLADDELGTAPVDPGTYEGADAKPKRASERLNKWCHRECERSYTVFPGHENEDFELVDLSKRYQNYDIRKFSARVTTDGTWEWEGKKYREVKCPSCKLPPSTATPVLFHYEYDTDHQGHRLLTPKVTCGFCDFSWKPDDIIWINRSWDRPGIEVVK